MLSNEMRGDVMKLLQKFESHQPNPSSCVCSSHKMLMFQSGHNHICSETLSKFPIFNLSNRHISVHQQYKNETERDLLVETLFTKECLQQKFR